MGKNFNQRLVGIGTTQPLGKGFNQLGWLIFSQPLCKVLPNCWLNLFNQL